MDLYCTVARHRLWIWSHLVGSHLNNVADSVLLLRDNCLLSVRAYYEVSKQTSVVNYTVK
jgi:hypothetical protein